MWIILLICFFEGEQAVCLIAVQDGKEEYAHIDARVRRELVSLQALPLIYENQRQEN
jgi:hypothetical protein